MGLGGCKLLTFYDSEVEDSKREYLVKWVVK